MQRAQPWTERLTPLWRAARRGFEPAISFMAGRRESRYRDAEQGDTLQTWRYAADADGLIVKSAAAA